MKLILLLGGPFHNHQEWIRHDEFNEFIEMREPTQHSIYPIIHNYRFAFGDDYIGIYYWNLNAYQAKAIQSQVQQMRNIHDREV